MEIKIFGHAVRGHSANIEFFNFGGFARGTKILRGVEKMFKLNISSEYVPGRKNCKKTMQLESD